MLRNHRLHRELLHILCIALGLSLVTALAMLASRPSIGQPVLGTPTLTYTATHTATLTHTPTSTATNTPTYTPTHTATPSPTATYTPTPSPTSTYTPSPTATPSATPTITVASEKEKSPTAIATATRPREPTRTPLPGVAGPHHWLQRPIGAEHWQSGSIFYPYGSTGHGQYLLHHGIDLANPMDTPVLAAADGEIIFAGSDHATAIGPQPDFYGNVIILKADRDLAGLPIYCVYGHLKQINVSAGQRVAAGQQIGTVGMSGIAIGPHLHFEVRLGQNDYLHSVNPDLWLEPLPGFGNIAGRVLDSHGEFLDAHPIAVYRAQEPDKLWREAFTYIRAEGIGPDPAWNENFVLTDVWAGEYILKTKVEDKLLTATVTVRAGETAFIEFRPPP